MSEGVGGTLTEEIIGRALDDLWNNSRSAARVSSAGC